MSKKQQTKCHKEKKKHRAKWLPYFKFNKGKVSIIFLNRKIQVNLNISISKAA